jgi:hypothetical protein
MKFLSVYLVRNKNAGRLSWKKRKRKKEQQQNFTRRRVNFKRRYNRFGQKAFQFIL